jgi:hypothetical protein
MDALSFILEATNWVFCQFDRLIPFLPKDKIREPPRSKQ